MTIGDRKLPKRSGQENGQANLRYKVFPLALCWRRLVVFLRCGSAGFLLALARILARISRMVQNGFLANVDSLTCGGLGLR